MITFEKTCNRRMTLEVTQVTVNIAIRKAISCHFLIVVCSRKVFMLHHFRNITIFTSYVAVFDLEMSFSFDTTVETTRHVYSDSNANKPLLIMLYFPRYGR